MTSKQWGPKDSNAQPSDLELDVPMPPTSPLNVPRPQRATVQRQFRSRRVAA
jgi:hypothetical protein